MHNVCNPRPIAANKLGANIKADLKVEQVGQSMRKNIEDDKKIQEQPIEVVRIAAIKVQRT